MIRYDTRFTGRVQGVGFRATTRHVARGFDVTGWVRNLPDGSVRCVAEGPRRELDAFLAAVQEAMSGCVRETRTEQAEATGEFDGFEVRL